jgi:Skp family chaperone for outer membrane proteins
MDDLNSRESEPAEVYDRQYYATHCGSLPYDHSCGFWAGFFGNITDQQYCEIGSISDKIEGRYDFVTCIEVLEHMPEADAIRVIEAMSKVTDRILFSSSPTDLDEPTHINVRPTIYWLRQFAAYGFAPDMTYDGLFILPHTLVLEGTETAPRDRDLFACAELVRVRLSSAERERVIGKVEAERARLTHELQVEPARVEYELVPERARIRHELEAEQARIDQTEAELIRAVCELETERERAAQEVEAERETAARELGAERKTAAREPGAERERIRRELESEWAEIRSRRASRLLALGKRVERSTRQGVRRSFKFVRRSAGLPWRTIQGSRGESL